MAKRRSSRSWERLSQGFLFFVSFYLYLWLYVDPRFIYHGAGIITNFPVFYKGWSFSLPFLSYPGGPVEYLSAFLSQLFYYSWAGALVITVQAWLISVCIDYTLKATNAPHVHGIRFLPPILLLVLYTRYTYFFETTLALLTALLTTCLYLKLTLSRTKNFSCISVFLFLSVVLYYLSGGAFLLFAVMCAVYELMFKFRWKMSLFYFLSTAVIPYVLGLLIFRVSILDAYSSALPFSWKILKYSARTRAITIVYVLYLLAPLILLVNGLWQILRKRGHATKNRTRRKSAGKQRQIVSRLPGRIFSWFGGSPKLKYITGLLLLLAVTGGAIFFSHNESVRTRFKVDYYACHKMWRELLASAQRHPVDPFVAHAVNRALYHRGRLGYDMFSWPQHPDYLFLSDEKYKWMYWQIFDVFLDLGVVNMAENALTECLEGLGSRPMILQRLALINMVKGNTGSAKIYLGALCRTLFHDDWAKQYLDRLRTDPDLSGDRDIQHLRSICLEKDCPIYALYKERTLLWLLEKNPQNRMAFEYLMAWYMLNKNLSELARKMELLPDFGYTELPTHYEQAAMIYAFTTKTPFSLSDYPPNPQVRRQFDEFSRILRAFGGNKQAAFKNLPKNLRNTYFFYNVYAPSGTKR
ncbi:MAG: hypothetical protein A2Z25_13250 [Planctomycetes bacterium RBG_16_55_9]|nr:MAG: hypothetical protein A2Z25_13250 [Planctomycetes bacterium RBG_16_55_9]